MTKIIILSLMSIFTFTGAKSCGSDSEGDYGKVVSYGQDKPIKFPDFTLTYTGETKKTSHFDNGNSFTFTYQNFLIKNDKDEKTISWSSGTGDIAPANFEFKGMKFMLELRYYEKENKRLGDGEMVITKL